MCLPRSGFVTLSLHDALPISLAQMWDLTAEDVARNVHTHPTLSEAMKEAVEGISGSMINLRSEEHTSELQSRGHLVCRLLLEKKKNDNMMTNTLTTSTERTYA